MGETFTDYKNIIISNIVSNQNLLKALTINDINFLDKPLTVLPKEIPYNYVYPYKGQKDTITTVKSIITMQFRSFKPVGNTYIGGNILFYIICHKDIVRTDYGNRYDYIYEELKNIFYKNCSIDIGGKLELVDVSDLDVSDNYMGSVCVFHAIDFQ